MYQLHIVLKYNFIKLILSFQNNILVTTHHNGAPISTDTKWLLLRGYGIGALSFTVKSTYSSWWIFVITLLLNGDLENESGGSF